MKNVKKKMLAGILAGTLLMAGGFGCYSVQAAQDNASTARFAGAEPPRGMRPPGMNNDEAAKHIAETFGVPASEAKKALEDGEDVREVGHAAMLAKVSGKSLAEVLSLKTENKSWQDIETELGIDKAKIRQEMDGLVANRLAERGNVDKDTALKLLVEGYRPHDIEMAGFIAKETGKDIRTVLDKKKINNRWSEVAKTFGVDENKLPRFGRWDGEERERFGGSHHGEGPQGRHMGGYHHNDR
jgi:hypothetical protein